MAITNNREQNGLHGRSAPADISADDPSRINLNALFFMASAPAKYQALVAVAHAVETDRARLEHKQKHDHETELAAVYQREIDRNMLKLNIDGVDVDISQGDLRKVMKSRVDDLEEQKRALQKSGKNPEELKRLDKLLQQYQPVITDLQKEKADPATMKAVQDLMKQDPELKPAIKAEAALTAHNADATVSMGDNKRTSFATQFFQDQTITAQPLKEAFAKGAAPAAPAIEPPPPAAPAVVEQKHQNLKNGAATMGF